MTNKIKDQKVHQPSSGSYPRHHHSHNKITESFVHRMIEKISGCESADNQSPFIIGHLNKPINDQSIPKSFINIKKEVIKTEVCPSRVGTAFRESKYRLKKEKQANNETDSCNIQSKDYRKKCSQGARIAPGKSSDFTSFIAERMMHMKLKKNRQRLEQQSGLTSNYYGLNVMQIKKVQVSEGQSSKEKQVEQLKSKTPTLSNSKGSIQHCKNKRLKTSSFHPQHKKDNQSAEHFSNKKISLQEYKGGPLINQKKLRPKTRILEIKQYQKKIKRMLDCMDIILNSYHCSLAPNNKIQINSPISQNTLEGLIKPIVKKQKGKYQYFVGPGNNANLIRSLLRKRSWWVQVDAMSKANFVWTQLKVQCVLEKIEAHVQEDWTNQIIFYEQISQQCQQMNSGKKSSSTASSDVDRVSQQSLDLLFHEKQSRRYRCLLDAKEAENRLQVIHPPSLLHNHYEQNYMFGNKNALYYNLSAYCEFSHKNLSQMVPLTFYLEKGNKKTITDFEKVFNECKKHNTVWILKPAENSNRGNGIEVTSSMQQIRLKLNLQTKLIVQYYMKNLLLYNYRKFDIRAYMIAVTVNGRTKFFWYQQGYIRTSSQVYDLENLRDQLIHLTNDAVQVKGDNYGKYQEGNKLSYSEFQRYLDTRFPRQTWRMSHLHEQMRLIALESVRATYCRIDPANKSFGFELFGLDFIVDNQFKPYLIEVNTNPCLQLSSPVLARLIPRMMENMFRITIDPLFRPSLDISYAKSELYYLYDESFLNRNKFSLIFDQKYDRDFEWEERCRSLKGWQWRNHEEEEYASEGQIITVSY